MLKLLLKILKLMNVITISDIKVNRPGVKTLTTLRGALIYRIIGN